MQKVGSMIRQLQQLYQGQFFLCLPVNEFKGGIGFALGRASRLMLVSVGWRSSRSWRWFLIFTVIVRLVLTEAKDFVTHSDLQERVERGNDSPPRGSLIFNRALSVTTFLQAQPITSAKTPILSRNWRKALSVNNKGCFRTAKIFS